MCVYRFLSFSNRVCSREEKALSLFCFPHQTADTNWSSKFRSVNYYISTKLMSQGLTSIPSEVGNLCCWRFSPLTVMAQKRLRDPDPSGHCNCKQVSTANVTVHPNWEQLKTGLLRFLFIGHWRKMHWAWKLLCKLLILSILLRQKSKFIRALSTLNKDRTLVCSLDTFCISVCLVWLPGENRKFVKMGFHQCRNWAVTPQGFNLRPRQFGEDFCETLMCLLNLFQWKSSKLQANMKIEWDRDDEWHQPHHSAQQSFSLRSGFIPVSKHSGLRTQWKRRSHNTPLHCQIFRWLLSTWMAIAAS